MKKFIVLFVAFLMASLMAVIPVSAASETSFLVMGASDWYFANPPMHISYGAWFQDPWFLVQYGYQYPIDHGYIPDPEFRVRTAYSININDYNDFGDFYLTVPVWMYVHSPSKQPPTSLSLSVSMYTSNDGTENSYTPVVMNSSSVVSPSQSDYFNYDGFAEIKLTRQFLSSFDTIEGFIFTVDPQGPGSFDFIVMAIGGITLRYESEADKIINGDGKPLPPDVGDDLENKVDDLEDLENEALGGKTDEQIKAEIDSALSFDINTFQPEITGSINGFFDNLLNAFGADYQALLMLALSLGLAAFIIGRRYSAG